MIRIAAELPDFHFSLSNICLDSPDLLMISTDVHVCSVGVRCGLASADLLMG